MRTQTFRLREVEFWSTRQFLQGMGSTREDIVCDVDLADGEDVVHVEYVTRYPGFDMSQPGIRVWIKTHIGHSA